MTRLLAEAQSWLDLIRTTAKPGAPKELALRYGTDQQGRMAEELRRIGCAKAINPYAGQPERRVLRLDRTGPVGSLPVREGLERLRSGSLFGERQH